MSDSESYSSPPSKSVVGSRHIKEAVPCCRLQVWITPSHGHGQQACGSRLKSLKDWQGKAKPLDTHWPGSLVLTSTVFDCSSTKACELGICRQMARTRMIGLHYCFVVGNHSLLAGDTPAVAPQLPFCERRRSELAGVGRSAQTRSFYIDKRRGRAQHTVPAP